LKFLLITISLLPIHLNNWVRGGRGNAAIVVPVSRHLDEPSTAPSGTPTVLHQPIPISPTNGQNTMVQLRGRASRFVVNTGGIKLEGRMRGINGNGDGCEGNRVEEIVFVSAANVVVACDGTDGGGLVFARVGSGCGVGISGFEINAVSLDDIFESLVHETSVATLVSFGRGAIDQILFGKAEEVLLGQKPSALDGTGGGEGPAGSALGLVLHSGDGSVLSPVPGVGSVGGNLHGVGTFVVGSGDVDTVVESGEFLAGEIAEFVHLDGEAASVGIPIVDKVEVGLEGLVTNLVFGGNVDFGVLTLEVGEGLSVLQFGEGVSRNDESENQ